MVKLRPFSYFVASFLAITLLVFTSSSYYFWQWLNTPVVIPKELSVFVVEPGDSLHKISNKLKRQGLLDWPKVWIAFAKYSGSTQINVGEFLLEEKESPVSLYKKLRSTDFVQYQLTIIEGASSKQAVEVLATAKGLEQLLEQSFDPSSTEIKGIEKPHLEGMFFADTYFYTRGESDISILRRSYEKLQKVLNEEWNQRAENLPYASPYEALIMASIIEKETGAPHERAEIAGVFVRRLEKGMRLQTDPTVIYGLQREWDGNITRADLKSAHPYNTYVIKGLPPTPIALVGREAIHAALHPKDGAALYFVAKGDGTHYFSDSFEEHKEAVKRYQLKRKEGYRSRYEP